MRIIALYFCRYLHLLWCRLFESHRLNKLLPENSSFRSALGGYFFATYLLLLWITQDTVGFAAAREQGFAASAFLLNAFLSYNALYLLPSLLVTWLAYRVVGWKWPQATKARHVAAAAAAVVTGALTTLFFYANVKLHALYGMFVNGFVVNLIVTPGGIESLGGSATTTLTFALIALGFVLGHALLLLGVAKVERWFARPAGRRGALVLPVVAVFVLSTVGDRAAYAYSSALGDSSILTYTDGIPYYVGMTARKFFKTLGFKVNNRKEGLAVQDTGSLNYPLHPLQVKAPAKPLNVVWLVSESWRADTLDQEIMPATWAFAQQAQRFTHHYSGGNGTRNGIFTIFTGIPGNYWDSFMTLHRGAPVIEVMQQQNYQMSLYTSAKFSYPEFDKTIFSKVPASQMHSIDGGAEGWQRDRQNVADLLKFIDQRDPNRPFFTFMFFESPHARYYFPPESVIRRPYRDDINYATLTKEQLRADIVPIKNRYLNSVHHLDSQFARVFDYLKANNLLDSTIVILAGDHGEEFMEAGYWGHNSTISDPQTRTPMVLWVPGMKPATSDKLTSHLDVIPTIMPLLGVTNPVQDYSVGISLLSPEKHDHVIVTAWAEVGYIDDAAKITLPTSVQGARKYVTDVHDKPLTGDSESRVFEQKQTGLLAMMKELGQYKKKQAN